VLKGFREFILRGNAVDLAVGIVIGVAFTAVITAVVNGFINPLIAALFGKIDLSSVGTFTINNANFSIGLILAALINFVLVAAAVYFVIVLPMNALQERRRRGLLDDEAGPSEVELLAQIRDELRARS
jgi:large conductance mechanosensitive channel